MALKDRLRRLERASREELTIIPLKDGSEKHFTQSDLRDSFLNAVERLGAGEDAPPRHALLEAARNSSDPWWRNYLNDIDFEGAADEPIEDLSVQPNG